MSKLKVVRGNSKSLKVYIEQDGVIVTDLTDWTCFIQLRDKRDGSIAGSVDREVTTKNAEEDRFLIKLIPAETNIPEGDYILGVEFRNSATGEVYEREDPQEITIKKQWVVQA